MWSGMEVLLVSRYAFINIINYHGEHVDEDYKILFPFTVSNKLDFKLPNKK